VKRLLLHACCAPDAAYCIQLLKPEYEVVCFFFNPNIDDPDEYAKREADARKVAVHFGVEYLPGDFCVEKWREAVRGLENAPEGGDRCRICYEFRLAEAAQAAAGANCKQFTTTLTISPHKNSKVLFELGRTFARTAGIGFLDLDFKKKDGFKKSVALSKELGLYRQNYCGCGYSKRSTA